MLLSRALERSTIAAENLNGRVRDGNGCCLLAMAASPQRDDSGISLMNLRVRAWFGLAGIGSWSRRLVAAFELNAAATDCQW